MCSHFSAAHHSTNVAVAPAVVYFIISLILCCTFDTCFLCAVTIVTFLTYGWGGRQDSRCRYSIKGDEADEDDYQGDQVECWELKRPHKRKRKNNNNIKMSFVVFNLILPHRLYYKSGQANVLTHWPWEMNLWPTLLSINTVGSP